MSGVDITANYCYALNMELLQKEIEKGQTLLIVVLIMVVSLTIGLSIASKTVTNLRTTTEEADSAKALSAAETGILQSIKTGQPVAENSGFISNSTKFSSSVDPVSGPAILVNNGNVIPQDEGADVWLISHDNSTGALIYSPRWTGTLTIYWGDSSVDLNNAALEVVKITGTSANTAAATRYGYDPASRSNNLNDPLVKYGSAGTQVNYKTFYYSATISGVTDGLLLRIIPLYTNTILAVAGTTDLPSQGSVITSTGKSSNVERKIRVVQNYYSLPSQFFTYGLFVPK